MKRFLFVTLFASLLIPTVAKAESVWLMLIMSGNQTNNQKFQMKDMKQCQKEGELFVNSGIKGVGDKRFYCVTGK